MGNNANERKSHCLDLVGKDGEVRPSNAVAIELLGRALEELERNQLWKMGGQVGGVREVAEISIRTNAGSIGVNVFLEFDAEILRNYIDGLDGGGESA